MGIGTSLGAHFDDEFHYQQNQWDPESYPDNNTISPGQMYQNKQMDQVDQTELGGIEVADKMPFPNNNNPDTDFNSRFGNLPPSGILNDIKPQIPDPKLQRKL